MQTFAAIIPCHNEEENVPLIYAELEKKHLASYQTII